MRSKSSSPFLSNLGIFVKEHFGDGGKRSSSVEEEELLLLKSSKNAKLLRTTLMSRNIMQIRCGSCRGHIQFPGFSQKPMIMKKEISQRAPTASTSTSTAKKKKRKGDSRSTTNLMDFLSSLNDH